MDKDQAEKISAYLRAVEAEWRTGQGTEHTYRPMLKSLLEGLLPKIMVINEPTHIECGAPDYILKDRRSALNFGFIEAKDIGDADLDGKRIHKEQFDRYKDSLDSLCFTDYLDFHFYANHDFIESVRIAEVKGDALILTNDNELERFVQLVGHLADAKPQRITSPSRLAELMAGKARLLAQGVRKYLTNDKNADSMLAQQMKAFRNILIHDIDEASFADVFAQTVTYGMFAARLHDNTPEDFSRAEAAQLIPKTNPLLRQMFQYIAMDTDNSIEWIVDDLVSLFAAVDVEKLMCGYRKNTAQTDPLLHFYEDFLAAYDPRLRRARGVWYTPKPVVDFIVRSVDHILERDFGLAGGLADPAKVTIEVNNDTYSRNKRKHETKRIHKEVHKVQILDPAAGTGTFLAEAVKLIHEKVVSAMGEGAWQGYVESNLLQRLNGFEILMASYAMAHLKLDMLLGDTGYQHNINERLRIFLTNSLEPYDKAIGSLFAAALAQEANEANFIKRDCPVMVVMGNPPYAVSSANKGDWIQEKIADYKKDLGERHILLDDDYIKFLRLGQYYVDKTKYGILAFISNNSFLDGITHRQMRKSLLKSFDDIYILNLHGNSRIKETTRSGGKDENVFAIIQGVSINIFVKHRNASSSLANVYHADIYGTRKEKYDFLGINSIENIKWNMLKLQSPYYFFVPKDFGAVLEYDKGFSIQELMIVSSTGVQTSRDELTVANSKDELILRMDEVADMSVATDLLRAKFFDITNVGKYPAGDSSFWQFEKARNIIKDENRCLQVHAYSYRPFDLRFIYYSSAVVHRPRKGVFDSFIAGSNLGLIICRQGQAVGSMPWNVVFVTDKISDLNMFYRGGGCTFPLYLYNDNMGNVEKVPNFDKKIYSKICEAVGKEVSPEAVFNYIYGVLHTPSYREKYKEFLKIDFPRIPYPSSATEFERIAEVGEKLVAVHLLKDSSVTNPFAIPYAKFEGEGDATVEKVTFDNNRVYINANQYFEPVPEAAWNFYIGGYQPAQKWLKDRKGRKLASSDFNHYKSIIAALMQTAALMETLEVG